MSNTVAMIIVVVAVVLVIAVVAFLLMRTRGQERRTREAQELRTQAAAQSTDVDSRSARPLPGRPPPTRRAQTPRSPRPGPRGERECADRGPARGHDP